MRGVCARPRRISIPPKVRDGAARARRVGPVEHGASLQVVVGAELALEHFRARRRCPEPGNAFLQKWRSECDVLSPADRTVGGTEILDLLVDADAAAAPLEAALDADLRERETRAHRGPASAFFDFVRRDRSITLGGHAGGGFLGRRPAEDIEAQIVAR